jgi:hypothetical protein
MVASFLRYTLAEKQTSSIFAKPKGQNMFLILLPFEINYTFSKTKTQLFFGTQLDDLIRFSLTQHFGVRQQFKKAGIFRVSMLLSGLPTRVWSDPYIANLDRIETDRNSLGFRFMWDLIFNSGLRVQYSLKKIKLDSELSGEYIGLPLSERKLLDRNGFTHSFELLYWIKLKNKHMLAPSLVFVYDDRNGEARAQNAYQLRLNYTWLGKRFSVSANTMFGYSEFKASNPIYQKTQQDTYYSLVATGYYKNPWGWKIGNSEPMNFFLNVAIYRSNTNIDFYFRDAFLISAGVFFRWAKN